jgi:endonuclease/exonuclease/phosphatase (EEP) superfamily protein YafD
MRALLPPVLLLGDLNMSLVRAERITGMTTLVRAETFPAARPLAQLDHVLALRGSWSVGASRSRLLPFSDHRALVVDLV